MVFERFDTYEVANGALLPRCRLGRYHAPMCFKCKKAPAKGVTGANLAHLPMRLIADVRVIWKTSARSLYPLRGGSSTTLRRRPATQRLRTNEVSKALRTPLRCAEQRSPGDNCRPRFSCLNHHIDAQNAGDAFLARPALAQRTPECLWTCLTSTVCLWPWREAGSVA